MLGRQVLHSQIVQDFNCHTTCSALLPFMHVSMALGPMHFPLAARTWSSSKCCARESNFSYGPTAWKASGVRVRARTWSSSACCAR